jgi:hypothetical protein
VGRPERKRQLVRLRHSWDDNIKIDLQEMGWEGMDCTDLAENTDRWPAVMNEAMKIRVP